MLGVLRRVAIGHFCELCYSAIMLISNESSVTSIPRPSQTNLQAPNAPTPSTSVQAASPAISKCRWTIKAKQYMYCKQCSAYLMCNRLYTNASVLIPWDISCPDCVNTLSFNDVKRGAQKSIFERWVPSSQQCRRHLLFRLKHSLAYDFNSPDMTHCLLARRYRLLRISDGAKTLRYQSHNAKMWMTLTFWM